MVVKVGPQMIHSADSTHCAIVYCLIAGPQSSHRPTVEMEIPYLRKRKQKWNVQWNRRGKETFHFREYGISVSTIGLWLLYSPTIKEHKMTQ